MKNALDLSKVSDAWARSRLSIRGVKMVRELQGQSCYGLENSDEPQKSILRSRSFGHKIRDYYELEAAVATFTAQAAVKLREQGKLAGGVMTFMYGSKHEDLPAAGRHGGSHVVTMMPPTNETGQLITGALEALSQIYDHDFAYKRAGVVLLDLRPIEAWQLAFDSDPTQIDRKAALTKTVDELNRRFGTRLVRHASEHLERDAWFSRRQLRSPAYTTRWSELPEVS